MSFIDCHSHLSFLSPEMVQSIISKAGQMGLSHWVMGGYDHKDWQKQHNLKMIFKDELTTCFGLHPWKVIELSDSRINEEMTELYTVISHAGLIGETGLDFFVSQGKAQALKQERCFRAHLELGVKKPYVFHIVQAHGKALEILNDYPKTKGFVHSFSGSEEVAKAYISKGIMLSIGPGVLNPQFKKLRETLKSIDLKSLLLESDAPEGPRELSYSLKNYFQVANEVAKIKQVDVQELLKQISENFKSLIYG